MLSNSNVSYKHTTVRWKISTRFTMFRSSLPTNIRILSVELRLFVTAVLPVLLLAFFCSPFWFELLLVAVVGLSWAVAKDLVGS